MTDFQQGMVVGAIVALYVGWLLLGVPSVRVFLTRRHVIAEAERRFAALEKDLTSGWVRQQPVNHNPPPPTGVRPEPPPPPPMRTAREGGCPPRAPEDVQ